MSPVPARPHMPMPDPGRAASRAVLGFVARFVAGWVVVLALVAWVPGLERWAVGHTVASLGFVARLFGAGFAASGTIIELGQVGMEIVPDCTPLMPTAALGIAVVAFPAPWRWRLMGLLAGAALMWAYNLLRIFALVPVLRHRPEWFEFIHVYLWQTMTMLVVFALFMAWLGMQRRPGAAAPVPAAPGSAPAPGPHRP